MERKLAAILSADVEGYSRLMGDDEAATVRVITEYRGVIASHVAGHGGRVVDSPGDNVLAEFASVVDGVRCAIDIQRDLSSRNALLPASRQMRFRIGLNLGDVIVEGARLYGDGVNIAARVQGLAEGGGVCLSGPAYDQVEGKLPVDYEFVGEQSVKNIARPVRVYRLHLEPRPSPEGSARTPGADRLLVRRVIVAVAIVALLGAGGWALWRGLGTRASPGLRLPDKPSLVVLPFVNLSEDPAHEYFSDGVTEDLITGLSKVSGLFVIARNSAFTYKGKPARVREVGQDLGVRYVLEGGVRRAGARVRITAQLVDATTGYQIWAERYDREMRDLFALQDEVSQRIIRALAVTLTEAERARLGRAPTVVLEAYDLVLRGHEERRRTTREGNAAARRFFARALELDPNYADACAGLGWAHLQRWQLFWSADQDILERARDFAERAVALDDALPSAYTLLGQIALWRKEHDRAIAQAERAVELAPNDADGYETLAEILGWAGRAEESIRWIRHAMRLNPQDDFFYLWTLGHAYYLLERRQEALSVFGRMTQQNPNFVPAHAYQGVLLGELGREREAREAWAKAGRLSPGASLLILRERLPYKRPADLARFLTAADRAGMS